METNQKKFFLKSKGMVFGGLTLALALIILAVELDGLPSIGGFWPEVLPHGQWFKVIGAGLSVATTLGGLWGRIVAREPIRFS